MIGGFVGFANLPNQVHRKSVKKGKMPSGVINLLTNPQVLNSQ